MFISSWTIVLSRTWWFLAPSTHGADFLDLGMGKKSKNQNQKHLFRPLGVKNQMALPKMMRLGLYCHIGQHAATCPRGNV